MYYLCWDCGILIRKLGLNGISLMNKINNGDQVKKCYNCNECVMDLYLQLNDTHKKLMPIKKQ